MTPRIDRPRRRQTAAVVLAALHLPYPYVIIGLKIREDGREWSFLKICQSQLACQVVAPDKHIATTRTDGGMRRTDAARRRLFALQLRNKLRLHVHLLGPLVVGVDMYSRGARTGAAPY